MAVLRLLFLGPLALLAGERPLPLPATQKAQSLLAYLVLRRGRPQPRSELAGIFWPEAPSQRARRSLNTALWHIRRVLPGDDDLLARAEDVQFSPQSAFWLDVGEFESLLAVRPAGEAALPDALHRLGQAVALYRGDFLAGLYDDWVLNERYALEARFLDALARLALAYERQGSPHDALAHAERLLSHDPLREDVHRLVIRLHLALGDTVAAARRCNRCRALLREELDVDPAPETLALCQPLFQPGWPAGQVPADPLHPAAPARLRRPPLVGRDRELAQLLAAWQEALAGSGHTVLVLGEAGVGKTRLVDELIQSAGWRDGIALRGCCYEHEQSSPYQPLVEALRGGLRLLPRLPGDALAPWMLTGVTALLPDLQEHYPDLAPPSPLAPPHAHDRLLAALTGFLGALAGQLPLLLVLEELHWAAEPVLAFFHYLARHVGSQRLLVVGTCRDDLPSPHRPLVSMAEGLVRDGLLTPIQLPRLGPEAVAELVNALVGPQAAGPSLARRLHQATAGNPFFVVEMLRSLGEQGPQAPSLPVPPSVQALIMDRVAQLPRPARELLDVAAVCGPEFDLDLLQPAWGRPEELALAALDDLLRHRLLRESAGDHDYAFEHDLVREVLYQGLHHHHRRRLHRRVGRALLRLAGDRPRPPAATLAHHFHEGQDRDPTLAALWGLAAGDEALAHYARREALRWYRQARTLLDRSGLAPASPPPLSDTYARLCLGEGQALRLLGDGAGARTVLEEGLRWANAQGARAVRSDLLCALGNVAHEGGDFTVAKDLLRQAAIDRQALGNRRGLAEVRQQLARTAYDAGDDPTEAEGLAREALSLSQEAGDRNLQGLALWGLGRTHYRRAELSAADACFGQALECFRQVGNREDEGWTHLLWGLVDGLRHQLDRARERFDSAEAIFRDLERPLGVGAALTQRGMVHLRRGELEAAEALWQEALSLFQRLGSRWEQAAVLWRLGLAGYHRGALAQAEAHLARGLALAQAIGHRELCLLLHLTAGDVHATSARWRPAEAEYSDALALGRATDDRRFLPRIFCGLAAVALARGDPAHAGQWVQEGRRLAAPEDVEAQGMLLRLASGVAQALGEPEEALSLLRQSVAALEGPPVPFELARSRAVLARLEAGADTKAPL